jgi:UDP-N-acetylmuramate--alanine ligase
MSLEKKNRVYFLGIGGIGMSALARYFHLKGLKVSGYDRYHSDLCDELEQEGIEIHYQEELSLIKNEFKDLNNKENILIVITPAVPEDQKELIWFRENGFDIKKRAMVLGEITKSNSTIAVAGTHGKTTISSCIAHLYKSSGLGCNAFLGGITKNYNTNFLSDTSSKIAVVEADEYDRSFLQLSPQSAIITAVDADHLDIYENLNNVTEAFTQFSKRINKGGKLLIKKEANFIPETIDATIATYSICSDADCTISDLSLSNGKFTFNLNTPWGNIEKITPGVTGKYNVENVVAAASLCLWNGLDKDVIRNGIASFTGVKRRFDLQVTNNNYVFIDDYAHHPEELKAFISSVKEVYPGKRITGIFQPHLFTRTRDFAEGFGESLTLLDKLLLMDIYPAREQPIEGITSETILEKVKIDKKKIYKKEELLEDIKSSKPEVLLTMGAGDIDQLVQPILNIVKLF